MRFDLDPSLDDLLDRVSALRPAPGERVVIGIAGAPGAGKSTLAAAVVAGLVARGIPSVQVPMDGFHLADVQLDRLGLRAVKGAPATFDGAGYAALLRRLRTERTQTVYAPDFERTLEQPLAGAIAVEPEVEIVVTEGNYLLLQEDPWTATRAECTEVWYVDLLAEVRLERLIARHVRFGKDPQAAREWVLRSDEANAALVAGGGEHADLVITTR